MIEIDTLPQLRDPVLVVALTGWVDAGLAGSGCVAFLQEQLESARTFGRIDLGDLMDLQQTRPTVHLVDGVSREIDWPEITLSAGRLGRDVVLCSGPEPSLRWRAVLGELVDVSRQFGVSEAFTVGGIPAMASHRRPVSVLATGTDEALVERAGAWRQDYSGPTGAQSVLQVMLGDAGIPTLALWAQVPHYLAGGASPPAIRAVLERLRDLAACRSTSRGSTTRPPPTCTGSRKASPIAPTCWRSSTRSRPVRTRSTRPSCRAATSSRPRSSASSATRAEPRTYRSGQ